ncbi:hypothetical protein ILUMI_10247, partial [Ignelater luminosus]
MSPEKGKIDWNFIQNLHEVQEKENIKLANSLFAAHVFYKNKNMKMGITDVIRTGTVQYFFALMNSFVPQHPVTKEFISEDKHEIQI